MELEFSDSAGSVVGGAFAFVVFVCGLAVYIFILIMIYRAVRAHERIADSITNYVELNRSAQPPLARPRSDQP